MLLKQKRDKILFRFFLASGDQKNSQKSWKRQLTYDSSSTKGKKYTSQIETHMIVSIYHYSLPTTQSKSLAPTSFSLICGSIIVPSVRI